MEKFPGKQLADTLTVPTYGSTVIQDSEIVSQQNEVSLN